MVYTPGQGETIAERRKHPRYPVKLHVQYCLHGDMDRQSFFSHSISRNLGIGGIALLVEERLETGQALDVKLELPSEVEGKPALSADHQDVLVRSRVVWRQPYTQDSYIVGVQFLDLEQQEQ